VAHRIQLVVPPQSTSVSPPFFVASAHVGAWHFAPLQTPLRQSLAAPHVRFVAHRKQLVAPPQSTSDSAPFFTESLQVAGWQLRADVPVQIRLVQSLDAEQVLPDSQAVHSPPQSVSVSLPFFTESVQLAV
jgi:hypothetical protein